MVKIIGDPKITRDSRLENKKYTEAAVRLASKIFGLSIREDLGSLILDDGNVKCCVDIKINQRKLILCDPYYINQAKQFAQAYEDAFMKEGEEFEIERSYLD